jgi:hypothetical protein
MNYHTPTFNVSGPKIDNIPQKPVSMSIEESKSSSKAQDNVKSLKYMVLMHEYSRKIGSFDKDLRDGIWDGFEVPEDVFKTSAYFTEKMAKNRYKRQVVPFHFVLNKLVYGYTPYHHCNNIKRISVIGYRKELDHKRSLLSAISKALNKSRHLNAIARLDKFKISGFSYQLLVWHFDMHDKGDARKVFSRPIWEIKQNNHCTKPVFNWINDFYLDLWDFIDALSNKKTRIPEGCISQVLDHIKKILDDLIENEWI